MPSFQSFQEHDFYNICISAASYMHLFFLNKQNNNSMRICYRSLPPDVPRWARVLIYFQNMK